MTQSIGSAFDSGDLRIRHFLRPYKRSIPDIYVTKTSLERALEVANAPFLTLERHGYRVMLAPSSQTYHRPDLDYREEPTGQWVDYHKCQPARPTVTFIGTVAIGLTLYELLNTWMCGTWWAHFAFTRINITPTILPKRSRICARRARHS